MDGYYLSYSDTLKEAIWVAVGGTLSGLTATRVPFAASATSVEDDAGLTYIKASDTLSVQGPLVLGIDAATNTAGQFKLFSAGANNYYTTVTAGEQTQNVAYVLPLDDGAASTFLQSNGSGVLSWAAQAAEADTLATVTGRGATTTTASTFATLGASALTLAAAAADEMVSNGTFTGSADNWTLGGGGGAPDWAYGTNAVAHGDSGGTTALEPTVPLTVVAGALYRVTYTLTRSAGSVTVSIGGTSATARSAAGKYVEFLQATTTGNLRITPTTTFVGTVDNVSAYPEDRWKLANVGVTTSTATVERSPAICIEGHAWDTDGSDDKWEFRQYLVPTSAATTAGTLRWTSSKNAAAETTLLTLSDGGVLTATSTTTAPRFLSNGANNAGIGFFAYSGTITTSTGQTCIYLTPTYNQTGSPANTDIYVRRVETALGTADARTGAQLLMDLGAGSSSLFRVDNQGRTVAKSYAVELTADAVMQPFSVVMADASADGRFDVNGAGGTLPIGVVSNLTGATAQGTAYSVVTDGLTYVIPDEDVVTITRGHVAIVDASRAGMVDDSASLTTAGLNVGRYLYSEAAITFDAEVDVDPAANTIVLDSTPTWAVGDPVVFWNSGDTEPTGMVDGTVYWIRSISTATVTLQASRGGAVTDITAVGSGTTCYLMRLPQVLLRWQ